MAAETEMMIMTLRNAAAACAVFAALIFASDKTSAAPAAPDKAAVEKIVREYLLTHPEILFEMQDALDTKREVSDRKARADSLAKVGRAALTDPKIAFVTGPADAKVTVVEFFDYRCVYCKASLEAMKTAIKSGGKVRFSFIEYPILTADSMIAARAAVAARRQTGKYVPFHLALMATQGDLPKERVLAIAKSVGIDVAKLEKDMNDPAVTASIEASRALAKSLRVDGTPTFLINDQFWIGKLTEAKLQSLIKESGG